eukprot:gene1064-2083_t
MSTCSVYGKKANYNERDPSLPLPISTHNLGQFPKRYNSRRTSISKGELTPLYPGYGTHFSYVYVGSPAQRQSVIIDTGSHYTAFPCKGCDKCGEHTDPYWDIDASSTAIKPKCNDNKECPLSQSYSEGSTWYAYKVHDKLWVGGISLLTVVPDGKQFAVNFTFGCQTSVTGLFKQQLADGIMGMSMGEDTLMSQLFKQNLTPNKIFALCFKTGGGIMTIGGVDQSLHNKKIKPQYTKITKLGGWFQVELEDVRLSNPTTKLSVSIDEDSSKFNSGKGVIVDSGTTDTYLPSAVSASFGSLFKSITGVILTNKEIFLNSIQLNKMPNIVFIFKNIDGNYFEIDLKPENYIENLGGGKYQFRIFLTETSGAVLGANFMTGYNIIFDQEGQRIGFAPSNCNYEEYLPTAAPSKKQKNKNCISTSAINGPCNAKCSENRATHLRKGINGGYFALGEQPWGDVCDVDRIPLYTTTCMESCRDGKLTRGDNRCPSSTWSECSKDCSQTRTIYHWNDALQLQPQTSQSQTQSSDKKCEEETEERDCYSHSCEAELGDYLIFLDMVTVFRPLEWSYVYSEDFIAALSYIVQVPDVQIQLLVDSTSTMSQENKLQFQIRLRKVSYTTSTELYLAAQSITSQLKQKTFTSNFISALNISSVHTESLSFRRFSWMNIDDIIVRNVMALPLGDIRDPTTSVQTTISTTDNNEDSVTYVNESEYTVKQVELFLLGIAIVATSIMTVVLFMHFRLRNIHFELEKDKPDSLREIWNRFKARRLQRFTSSKSSGRNKKKQHQQQRLSVTSGSTNTNRNTSTSLSVSAARGEQSAEMVSFIRPDNDNDDVLEDEEVLA